MTYVAQPATTFRISPSFSTVIDDAIGNALQAMLHAGLTADPMPNIIDTAITAAVQSSLGRTGSNSPADCYPSAACGAKHHVRPASTQSFNSAGLPHSTSLLCSKYHSSHDHGAAQQQPQMLSCTLAQSQVAAGEALRQQQLLLLERQQAVLRAATAAAGQQPTMPLYGHYNRSAAGHGTSSTAHQGSSIHADHHMASSLDQQCAAAGAARLPSRPTAAVSSKPQQQQHTTRPADCYSSEAEYHHITCASHQQLQHNALTSNSTGASAGTAFTAPAQAGPLVGRWRGQVAVLHVSPSARVCEPDGDNSSFSLECEEELLSLGVPDLYFYQARASQSEPAAGPFTNKSSAEAQGLHSYNFHVEMLANDADVLAHIEQSGSSKGELPSFEHPAMEVDMEQEQDACHTGDHKDQADKDRQQATMQMLKVVSAARDSQRQGKPVLTSTCAAAAAGSESVRPRLLITEVSVYMSNASTSQMALDQANMLMHKQRLPGNVEYMPVSPDSFLFKAGAAWQFPAFVICLGSSYLQRTLARLPQLAEAVLACPGFEEYANYLPQQPVVPPHRLSGADAVATLATLRSVQFTCLYLATKVADQIHALGLLRFMLTNLSHNGTMVTIQQAANVESSCLEALGWRLGPFFLEDDLSGNDEELWAHCMGHFEYGTEHDTYPDTF